MVKRVRTHSREARPNQNPQSDDEVDARTIFHPNSPRERSRSPKTETRSSPSRVSAKALKDEDAQPSSPAAPRSAPSGAPVLPIPGEDDEDEEYDDSPEFDIEDVLIVGKQLALPLRGSKVMFQHLLIHATIC